MPMLELPEKDLEQIPEVLGRISSAERNALEVKSWGRITWGISSPFSGDQTTEVQRAYKVLRALGYTRNEILKRGASRAKTSVVNALEALEVHVPQLEELEIEHEEEKEEKETSEESDETENENSNGENQ